MKFVSLKSNTPDGELRIINNDGSKTAKTSFVTLQAALENWSEFQSQASQITNFDQTLTVDQITAPLPRAWQWLDGSVFPSHGALMDKALGIKKDPVDFPLMYQGVSDKFYGPTEDVTMIDEALGIDFEGEFGIITDYVPMGTSAEDAMDHIKLVVQINDWSLRALAGKEMGTGFGWIQAKPHCSMAPFALTPDELGENWRDGRVDMNLEVDWNSNRFGAANGYSMKYGFHELVAHAARTRNLVAGTVIGSGTVSNANYRDVGSSCIAERRGIEIVDYGQATTNFMKFGDSIKMRAVTKSGEALFGTIDQKVISND